MLLGNSLKIYNTVVSLPSTSMAVLLPFESSLDVSFVKFVFLRKGIHSFFLTRDIRVALLKNSGIRINACIFIQGVDFSTLKNFFSTNFLLLKLANQFFPITASDLLSSFANYSYNQNVFYVFSSIYSLFNIFIFCILNLLLNLLKSLFLFKLKS